MIVNAHLGYYTGQILLDGVDVSAQCFMADDTPGEDGSGTVVLLVTEADNKPHCDWGEPDPFPYVPVKESPRLFFSQIGINIGGPVLMLKTGHVEITPGEVRPREIS